MARRTDEPALLAKMLDHSPYVAALVQDSGLITWCNLAVTRVFGYDVDEVVGTNIFDHLDVEWDPAALETVGNALIHPGLRLPTYFRAYRKNGTTMIVEVWANSQLDDSDIGGLVAYLRCWDERVLLDEALETLASNESVEHTMRLLLDAMACETLEAHGAILSAWDGQRFRRAVMSPGLDPVLGDPGIADSPWVRAQATGTRQQVSVADLPPALRVPAVAAGWDLCWAWPAVDPLDGSVPACVVAWRRSDELEADQSRSMMMDRLARITQLRLGREDAIDRLRHAATHDDLTGLANRAHFYSALEMALAGTEGDRPGPDAETAIGVLYLDLDGFKPINDRLGHRAGDLVLTEVAHRLNAAVRDADLVARLGGDEFAVLCPSITSLGELEAVAGRLLAAVQEPLPLHDDSLSVGVSIGIALGPPGGRTGDQLIEAADAALINAKAEGKGRWSVGLASSAG